MHNAYYEGTHKSYGKSLQVLFSQVSSLIFRCYNISPYSSMFTLECPTHPHPHPHTHILYLLI